MKDPAKAALIEDSPWKLGNTDDKLVVAKKGAEPDLIKYFQTEGINRNANGLADGLRYTFVELWEALKDHDMIAISMMCEGDLRNRFADYFEQLEEEDCKLVGEGQSGDDTDIDLQIVDYLYARGTFSMQR